MEEMIREDGGSQFTLQAIFKALKKKLLLIIAVTLLFTAVGGVFGAFVVDTQYTTSGTMIVNVGNDGTLADAQSLATALKSITDPGNDRIYKAVTTKFNATHPNDKITIAELQGAISVTANSVLLNITMTTSNPKADLILDEFMSEIKAFANEKDASTGAYKYHLFAGKVDVISYASTPSSDAQTKVFKNMVIFFVIGAFGSVLVVLLMLLLNDTYANKVSFEKDFAIDVLATIEDFDGSNDLSANLDAEV